MTTPPTLRRRVLARITPSPATTRRATAAAGRLGRRIQKEASRRGLSLRPVLVGSLAKGTHLRPPEVDLFLLFPPAVSRRTLETEGLDLAGAFLTQRTDRFAEHPYAHGRFGGFRMDVVPAYDIPHARGRLSAVDRTPFHTDYVRSHLSRTGRNEVRLLKQFLRGIAAYGAETAVGGFSGYLAELLVLRYGTFDAVLAAAATRWGDRVALRMGRESTDLGGCFVFVDPVDPERNAAAAIVPRQLGRVRRAAAAYRGAPHERFFFPSTPRPPSAAELRPLLADGGLTGLQLPAPATHEQAQQPHAARLLAKVVRRLERRGFHVDRHDVVAGDGAFFLIWDAEPARLPSVRTHRGPRVEDADHAAAFRARWDGHASAATPVTQAEGRLSVRVRTDRRTPHDVVAHELEDLMDGTRWTPAQRRRVKVLTGPDWLRSPARRLAASRFLTRREPWEG